MTRSRESTLDLSPSNFVCDDCKEGFDTEEELLAHPCPARGDIG